MRHRLRELLPFVLAFVLALLLLAPAGEAQGAGLDEGAQTPAWEILDNVGEPEATDGPATTDEQEAPGEDASPFAAELRRGNADQGEEDTISVSYVERSWNGTTVVSETKNIEAVAVPASGDMTSGWYYLNSNVTVNGRIELKGDTNLILGDGFTLDVKGIYIPMDFTLTIYAQSDGKGAGTINSHPSDGSAIGAYSGHWGGSIVIHGGNVTAKGANHCAAIGSNDGDGEAAPITIYGGTINATGGSDGAGIGGGRDTKGGTITIYGGTVNAKGGGENGAGIGGGDSASGGIITIWGGTITANEDPNEDGAGIGGGDGGSGGTITINGGTVTTYSRDGAGIGGGDDGEGGFITINGGTVTCWDKGSAQGARIGGGSDADGGTITITGGVVDVHSRDGAGIGGGEDADGGTITISGGEITTYPEGQGNGAGIGGGNHSGGGGTITITGGVVYANSGGGAGIGGGRRAAPSWGDLDTGDSGSGGTITITGGEVRAFAEMGMGIGAGGLDRDYDEWDDSIGSAGTITIKGNANVTASGWYAGIGGDGGTITIEGGAVTATGNEDPGKGKDASGYGIRLRGKTGDIYIYGGTVTATGYGDSAGIGIESCSLKIMSGTTTATADKGAGIGSANGEDANGTLTINGLGTWVTAKSKEGPAIGGKGSLTCKFDSSATIEAISGDTEYQTNAFYGSSRVTVGKTKESAQLVAHYQRETVNNYRLVEPCDHEGTTTKGVCWACGYAWKANYVERGWDEGEGEVVSTMKAAENASQFPTSENDTLAPGWYVLNQNIKVNGRVTLAGDTHLILCDGFTLDVKGIYVPEGSTLYVYGQNMDPDEDTGKIYSHPSEGAAIGAYAGHPGGDVVVYGGVIVANGHDHCAGIGSNDWDGDNVGSFTMYGGTVTATGGSQGAGIGGGRDSDGGTIKIYGGTVTATGKDSSAGIGGGDASASQADGASGSRAGGSVIEIYGGTVTATGGSKGAGIGSGEYGSADITISGGTVTATGNSKGAGIGGGEYGYAIIAISGGTVTATGGSAGGAGIGSGADGSESEIAITGGQITADCSGGGYGIGNGKNTVGSVVTLSYTDETKESISILAASFNGVVTLEKPFYNLAGVFEAGVQKDLQDLAISPLLAWTDEILSWQQLQMKINQAGIGETITLTRELTAGEGDSDLVVPKGKDLTINLAGHTLDRNASEDRPGSVIKVERGAGLAIKNSKGYGVITGAYGEHGAIDVDGRLGLYGVNIIGNRSTGDGGGIHCAGIVVIEGGSISSNVAAGKGGGVYVADGGTLKLYETSIMQNSAGGGGGGVYVSEAATMYVRESPTVKDNRGADDTRSNVLLASGAVITLGDILKDADIYVSREDGYGVITSDYGRYHYEHPSVFFHADGSDDVIVLSDGEAEIVGAADAVTVSFDTDGAGQVAAQIIKRGTCAKEPNKPSKEGCRFIGWRLVTDGEMSAENFDFSTPITEDALLKAFYIDVNEHAADRYEIMTLDGAPAIDSPNMPDVVGETLTQDELDAGYYLLLVSSPLAEVEVPSGDKAALASQANDLGATAGTWFDISLYKVLGEERTKLTEAGCPVDLTVSVPAELQKDGRTFYLLSCHDGTVTVAAQGTGDTLAWTTDKFSTYLIAYKDDGSGSGSGAEGANNAAGAVPAQNQGQNQNVPRTGDGTLAKTAAFVFGCAVLALVLATGGRALRRAGKQKR